MKSQVCGDLKPYRIDVDTTYDNDRAFDGIAEVLAVNNLSEARTLGFHLTADSPAQDYRRVFFSTIFGKTHIISTAPLFAQHEQISIFDGYDQGLSIQPNHLKL